MSPVSLSLSYSLTTPVTVLFLRTVISKDSYLSAFLREASLIFQGSSFVASTIIARTSPSAISLAAISLPFTSLIVTTLSSSSIARSIFEPL